MDRSAPVLEMIKITKEFPGVKALSDVSFTVMTNEVHALCGENGAGKSTLMKILSGYYPSRQYQGQLRINGAQAAFGETQDSEKAGIAIIYQELSLVPEMNLIENIFLGRERLRLGWLKWKEMELESLEILRSIGLDLDPSVKVCRLGVGQQQLVEIARALIRKPRLLVLDEPTSALSRTEIARLLEIIKKLRTQGVSCVLISHKLDEVLEVADRITVLRDGKSVATYARAQTSEKQIIADMVGRELTDFFPRSRAQISQNVGSALEVKGLTVLHPKMPGKYLLEDISFSVKPGEIVGVAGLMGAGRTELLLSLFGAAPGKWTGKLSIGGKSYLAQSPDQAILSGLALVSEDRKRFGLILEDPILKNMTLSFLGHLKKWGGFGWVDRKKEVNIALDFKKRMRLKAPSLDLPANSLSGGNQQKVVLSKCLMTSPKILFLDEPTRGIDIGSKAEIYQRLDEWASQGMAILMVSSEIPEILGICDRVLVMNSGKLCAEFPIQDATPEKIMSAATGLERNL